MDSDCVEGLYCNQREPNDEVPGCEGGGQDSTNYDYCTFVAPTMPPTPMPAPYAQPTQNMFRLRMYWEQWYFWQEELFDRMWCMECKDGCINGHSLHIMRCSGDSAYFNFVYLDKEDPDLEQEVLMRIDSTESCLERDAELGDGWDEYTPLTLQECNSANPRQRWYATYGSLEGPIMEIGQYDLPEYCISQQHFPKAKELVRMEQIGKARYDTSSYWFRY